MDDEVVGETATEDRVFPAGKLKRLHVHQLRLQWDEPALIVRIDGTSRSEYYNWIELDGPVRMVQPGKTLSCGAKAWVETTGEVRAGVDKVE